MLQPEIFLHDLRFAVRTLRKSPGVTAVAVLTLALGIGANTAVFSMVSALLLHPYNFRDLDRLVRVWEDRGRDEGIDARQIAPADAKEIRATTQVFEGLATYAYRNLNLDAGAGMQPVRACAVSANFFDVLGVEPAIGRTFGLPEERPGADQVAVLGYGFWQRRFGGATSPLGSVLQMDGRKYTVIGVMPAGFDYPVPMELWIPLALNPSEAADRSKLSLDALGRLRRDVTLPQALAQLEGVSRRLQQEHPETNAGRRATLLQLRKELYTFTLPLFLLLQTAAAFVLLLACANLASILFARVLGRQREIAVRTALGAGWWRLTSLFVTETLLFSCFAGAVAILTSFWSVNLLRTGIARSWTMWVPGWDGIQVDGSVVAFAVGLVTLVGILFGLGFVVRLRKVEPYSTLKEMGRNPVFGGRGRLRSALVVAQVVFALVLLVCAGLTTDAFLRLANVYRGFQAGSVLRTEIALPVKSYPEDSKVSAFYQRTLAGAAALPGVEAASLVANSPASNVDNETTLFTIEGRPALKSAETLSAALQLSTPDYFQELRIPLLGGRLYTDADSSGAPQVVLISRSMAKGNWPDGSAVGRRIKLGAADSPQPWMTVVGVVEDVRQNWWNPTAQPTIYRPFLQAPRRSMVLLLRTSSAPTTFTSSLRHIIQGIDPQVAVAEANTLDREITDSIAIVRIMGTLMAIFGCVALTLASLGVYGVLAESVARRIPEMGVRLALGAEPRDLLGLVIGKALRLTLVGLALGVPISFLVNRALSTLILGIININVSLLAGFALLLLVVAIVAAFLPARRAMRVDPINALRYE